MGSAKLAVLDSGQPMRPAQGDAWDPVQRSDIGNGRRFAALAAGVLLWVDLWRDWLFFDKRRWARGAKLQAIEEAKGLAEGLVSEAEQVQGDEDIKEARRWAHKSCSRDRLHALVDVAKSEAGMAAQPSDFDRDPWVLNVENGTLDLRTMELRPHSRDDRLTKLAPVVFDRLAECPIWLAFLAKVMGGNPRLIAYIQRVVGYALTGLTSEQVFFFLFGAGANGKSTFLSALRMLLGDYAQNMRTEALLALGEPTAGPTPDLARLMGARFVAASETEQGRRLAESLIKQMTGGDAITARFLNANPFEFTPTHKLFLAANHKPEIRGTDHAIWRRVHLIPFTVTIPPEERDPDLVEKLRAELPGILAWAAIGCEWWKGEGLNPPEEVLAAVEEYRAEMDTIGEFLTELCEVGPKCEVRSADIYARYEAWSEARGEHPRTQRKFNLELQTRGFEKRHTVSGKKWLGVGLMQLPTDWGQS